MNRRDLLRHLGRAGVVGALATLEHPMRPLPRAVRAQTAPPALVVVFLRGACDGLNALVPHGDPDYYALRPEIAIAPPVAGAPHEAIDLDGFFGLHPALAPLVAVYDAGDLAILPAVHHDEPSRSHFLAQDILETAVTSGEGDGWLGRYLAATASAGAGPVRALSLGDRRALSLLGDTVVSSYADVADLELAPDPADAAAWADRLERLHGQPPDLGRDYRELMAKAARRLLSDLEDLGGTTPAPAYPDTRFARHLSQAAALLRRDLGLEIVTVDLGGWDTHIFQGGAEGQQATALAELAGGLAAFHADTSSGPREVLTLIMTEFGRTARENANRGTDHGGAAAWMVMGAGVAGGIHLGGAPWPGLDAPALREGRELVHTIDFRDVLAEVVAGYLGTPHAAVLPGWTRSSLGLLAA